MKGAAGTSSYDSARFVANVLVGREKPGAGKRCVRSLFDSGGMVFCEK